MRTRHLFSMLLPAAVALAGCAVTDGDDPLADEAEDENVETSESAISALEYDVATRVGHAVETGYPYVRNRFGWGTYRSSGDIIYLNDLRGDGRSVGVHWRTGSRRGICRSTLGAFDVGQCNKDFPEGQRIEIRFGRCNGTVYSCRTLTGWTDWTEWRAGGT